MIMVFDLLIIRKYCGFSIKHFIRFVLFPILYIILLSAILSLVIVRHITVIGLGGFAIKCLLSFVVTCIIVYFIGLTKEMKETVLTKLKTILVS